MSTRPWKTAIHVRATLNYLRAGNPFDINIARSTSPRSSAKLATVHLRVNTVLGTQQSAGLAGFFLSNIPTTVAAGTARAYSGAGAPTQDRKYVIDDQCAAGDKAGIDPRRLEATWICVARATALLQRSNRAEGIRLTIDLSRRRRLVHGFRGTLDFTIGVPT